MIATLAVLLLVPASGGALMLHLWQTRPVPALHTGLAVGQIPQRRRRHAQAIRRNYHPIGMERETLQLQQEGQK